MLGHLFDGLSLGSILLLISLGLAFIFGLMNVINMAHGEFIMVGAYVAYEFQVHLASLMGGVDRGIWFIAAIPAAFVVTALLGVLLELLLIRHLYGRTLDTLLATWGVGIVMRQAARSIFGAPNVQVSAPSWLQAGLNLPGGVVLPYDRLFIFGLALLSVISLYFYLYRSSSGRRLRAVMQNREMASCLGVNTRMVDAATFGLGTGLAGIAGCVLTLIGPIGPSIGTHYIVDAFIVIVLGGVGSLPGAVLAAVLIGVGNTYLELWSTASLGKVLIFAVVIGFLQWKPSGLVARKGR